MGTYRFLYESWEYLWYKMVNQNNNPSLDVVLQFQVLEKVTQ
jgi:hypothetical protein